MARANTFSLGDESNRPIYRLLFRAVESPQRRINTWINQSNRPSAERGGQIAPFAGKLGDYSIMRFETRTKERNESR